MLNILVSSEDVTIAIGVGVYDFWRAVRTGSWQFKIGTYDSTNTWQLVLPMSIVLFMVDSNVKAQMLKHVIK